MALGLGSQGDSSDEAELDSQEYSDYSDTDGEPGEEGNDDGSDSAEVIQHCAWTHAWLQGDVWTAYKSLPPRLQRACDLLDDFACDSNLRCVSYLLCI